MEPEKGFFPVAHAMSSGASAVSAPVSMLRENLPEQIEALGQGPGDDSTGSISGSEPEPLRRRTTIKDHVTYCEEGAIPTATWVKSATARDPGRKGSRLSFLSPPARVKG